MTDKEVERIYSNFTEVSLTDGEDEELKGFLIVMEYVDDIKEDMKYLKGCLEDYWKLEADASTQTKMLMLMNNIHSPFELCTKLVKTIETKEEVLKKICKEKAITFKDIGYKPVAKEAANLLRAEQSKQPLDEERKL